MSQRDKNEADKRGISRAGLIKGAIAGGAGAAGVAAMGGLGIADAHAAEGIRPKSVLGRSSRRQTSLLVRVQARGGKYLGDDIGGAAVTVRDAHTGEILASGVTSGDSGVLQSAYVPEASQSVIVSPATSPETLWLVPDTKTSAFRARLDLIRPTLVEVSAFGPIGGLQTAHRVSTTQWMRPGGTAEMTIEIPGLLVQVMEPATHLELPPAGSTVPLTAKVAMMCGCPIATGQPWLPSDFSVRVYLHVLPKGPRADVPLRFSSSGMAGIFEGRYRVETPGYYEATFEARQLSTGNVGLGQVTFFTAPVV